MPSNARKKFDDNASDIEHLIHVYEGLEAIWKLDNEPVPEGYEVLFRSAVVLMVSHWEAYVEDVCSEALEHLVKNLKDPTKLPKELKKQIAEEVKGSKNEIEVWKLVGVGWKQYVVDRLNAQKEARDRSFNTPKAQNTSEFFARVLGIDDVRRAWVFDGMESKVIARKLDSLVATRGEIAHRGRVTQRIDAMWVTDHVDFLRKVVSKTGGAIHRHLKQVTGTGLW